MIRAYTGTSALDPELAETVYLCGRHAGLAESYLAGGSREDCPAAWFRRCEECANQALAMHEARREMEALLTIETSASQPPDLRRLCCDARQRLMSTRRTVSTAGTRWLFRSIAQARGLRSQWGR